MVLIILFEIFPLLSIWSIDVSPSWNKRILHSLILQVYFCQATIIGAPFSIVWWFASGLLVIAYRLLFCGHTLSHHATSLKWNDFYQFDQMASNFQGIQLLLPLLFCWEMQGCCTKLLSTIWTLIFWQNFDVYSSYRHYWLRFIYFPIPLATLLLYSRHLMRFTKNYKEAGDAIKLLSKFSFWMRCRYSIFCRSLFGTFSVLFFPMHSGLRRPPVRFMGQQLCTLTAFGF